MTELALSTIIPVFNGAAFIGEALESIAAQRRPPAAQEIIVVDDGSTDDTPAVVQAFGAASSIPVIYLRQENRGPAAARNLGIARASGALLAFLDADDRWTPDKLEIQMPLLEGAQPAEIALGYARLFRRLSQPNGGAEIEEQSDPLSFLVFQAALIRRAVFEQVGPLNETLRLHEDTEWFLRARQAGVQIKIHPDPVLLYRRHDFNLTKESLGSPAGLLPLLKQSLARRRQAGPKEENR